MVKYHIIFIFLLSLTYTHSLCATEIPDKTLPEAERDFAAIEAEEGNWTGIDVSIVGKYAEKYGYPPRDPYINTDQGDLLLFVFTVAGLVGGIIIGYNFRKLFVEGKERHNLPRKVTERSKELTE